MTLSLLIEPRQSALDLTITNRENIALRCTSALQRTTIATFVRIRIRRVNIRLIPAKIRAVAPIERIQEDVESPDAVYVYTVSVLVQASPLWPDDGICGHEVERTFDDFFKICNGCVGSLSAVDADELWLGVWWNWGRCVVLEEDLEVGKVEVVCPFRDSYFVTAVVCLAHWNSINCTKTIDCDQFATILGTSEASDSGNWCLQSRPCICHWFQTVKLDRRHDEVDMLSNTLWEAV